MRRVLLLLLMLAGTGCQGFHDRLACRRSVCVPAAPEDVVAKKGPAEVKAPRSEIVDSTRGAPTIAQDVLLVPVTSYVPYARQTPVGPVRIAMGPQEVRRDVVQEQKPEPKDDTVKKLMEMCQKQCERIEHLEKCLRERPAVVCPPSAPECRPPLFRRPLFGPRCEPLHHCEPLPQCEPAPGPMAPATTTESIALPRTMPAKKTAPNIE